MNAYDIKQPHTATTTQTQRATTHAETPRSLPSSLPAVFTGKVVRVDEDASVFVYVDTKDGECVKARTTASCLLAPAVDDFVLLAQDDSGLAYVLSVIQQAVAGPLHVSAPQGMYIETNTFDVVASESMKVTTPQLHEQAVERTQISQKLYVATEEGTYRATKTNVVVDRCSTIMKRMTSSVQHAWQSFKTVSREVSGLETNKACTRNDTVDSALSISAQNAKVESRGALQLNARQIFMN